MTAKLIHGTFVSMPSSRKYQIGRVKWNWAPNGVDLQSLVELDDR